MMAKGKQMIQVLNEYNIDCACLGNHDFDFGLDILLERIKESNFPWLISNVFDCETNRPLGDVKDRLIINFEGIKVI
jgi:5'-nucleotidase